MNQAQLTATRRIIKEINNSYDRINWGGCGAFAAMFAKHVGRMTDTVHIVAGGGKCDINESRNNIDSNSLSNWESEGVTFYHVWVEFKCNNRWYALDADGIKRRNAFRDSQPLPCKGEFTVKEMQELGDQSDWNPSFPRDQLPSMKNVVGRRFNALLN